MTVTTERGWERSAPRELDAATQELVLLATALARRRNISDFVLPEMLLLGAIETAAKIDGTAEGTIDWLETVVTRLRAAVRDE